MTEISKKVVSNSLKRLGRPLTFVFVTLGATLLMLFLYGVRTELTEKRNYPIVVTRRDNAVADQKMVAVKANYLVEKIAGTNVCAELPTEDAAKAVAAIICRSVDDVKYMNFKNEAELSEALQKSAAAQRGALLKYSQTDLELREKNLYAFEMEKAKAQEVFDKKLKDLENPAPPAAAGEQTPDTPPASAKEDVGRKSLETLAADYRKLATAPPKSKDDKEKSKEEDPALKFNKAVEAVLADVLKDPKREAIKGNELTGRVKAAFQKKEDELTGEARQYREKIESIGNAFEPAIEKLYAAKDLRLRPPANPLANLFFADDGGLLVVYNLVMLTLTAIVVFSLLFLILIPLRNIFFLDAATGALADKAKGLVALTTPRVDLGGTAGALLATVATVGIGVAAIAATPFPDNPEAAQKDAPDKYEITKNYAETLKTKYPPKPGNGEPADRQIELDALAANVLALNQSVEYLDDRITNWEPVVVRVGGDSQPVDLSGVNRSLSLLNNSINNLMNRPVVKDPDIAATRSLVDSINTGVKRIDTKVGIPTSDLPPTLFGNFSVMNPKFDSLATTLGDASKPASVLGKLNTVSTDTVNLLKNDVTLLTNVSDVATKTSEVGRYVLGGPGNNLGRQLRTLFSGQQYTVTTFAINELKNLNSGAPDAELGNIIAALEGSLGKLMLRSFTADDLLRELNRAAPRAITKDAWKKWKKTVLASTRVTRS